MRYFSLLVTALFASAGLMTSPTLAAPAKHVAKVDVKTGICPEFKGISFIYPHTKTYGNMYHLMVENSQIPCAKATAWAKKLMRQHFAGRANLPHDIEGPHGYYCHVSIDAGGHGYMGGCTMMDYGGPIAPTFSWLPGNDSY